MDIEYDPEERDEYNEFIKEYGWREEWDFDNPEFTPRWDDWRDILDFIESQWNSKAVKYWREGILQRFVNNLPDVKNKVSLFHGIEKSDTFKLPHILSLIELPNDPRDFKDEIWVGYLNKFGEESDYISVPYEPRPMISGTIPSTEMDALDKTDFISAFSNYIREIGGINPNLTWFTNNYMQ